MAETTWFEEAKKNAGFLVFMGVLTVLFGVAAIAAPLASGVAVTIVVGALMLMMGIARLLHAFKAKQWGVGIWGSLVGLLSIGAGVLMWSRPLLGLATMTLLLAAYFLIDGVCEIVVAFRMRPDAGWGWMLFGGIVAAVLGLMIWRQWPLSGGWAIGTLFGVHILMTGWSMIVLGTGARRLSDVVEEAVEDVVDQAGDAAEKVGDVVENTVDRVQDVAEDVADRAEDVVDDLVDSAKNALDRDKD